MSERQIANIESGVTPRPTQATIRCIANVLKVEEYLAQLAMLPSKPVVASVVQAYEELSERERHILRLSWVESRSESAIAVDLGIEVNDVRSTIDGAKQRLEHALNIRMDQGTKQHATVLLLLGHPGRAPRNTLSPVRSARPWTASVAAAIGIALGGAAIVRCNEARDADSQSSPLEATNGPRARPSIVPSPSASHSGLPGPSNYFAFEDDAEPEPGLRDSFWSSVNKTSHWRFGNVLFKPNLAQFGPALGPEMSEKVYRAPRHFDLSSVVESGYAAAIGEHLLILWPPNDPQICFLGVIAAFTPIGWDKHYDGVDRRVAVARYFGAPHPYSFAEFVGEVLDCASDNVTRIASETLTPAAWSGFMLDDHVTFDDIDAVTIVHRVCDGQRTPVCSMFQTLPAHSRW